MGARNEAFNILVTILNVTVFNDVQGNYWLSTGLGGATEITEEQYNILAEEFKKRYNNEEN